MKVTFQLYHNIQVGGSGHPYSVKDGDPLPTDGHIEAIVTGRHMLPELDDQVECFLIEGTCDSIEELGRQLMNLAQGVREVWIEQGMATKPVQLPKEGN